MKSNSRVSILTFTRRWGRQIWRLSIKMVHLSSRDVGDTLGIGVFKAKVHGLIVTTKGKLSLHFYLSPRKAFGAVWDILCAAHYAFGFFLFFYGRVAVGQGHMILRISQ